MLTASPMDTRKIVATRGTADSLRPKVKVNTVAPLVAQPGQVLGRTAPRTKMKPQGSHIRENPVTAVSPVIRV
jgi:hypothetical protein